MQNSLSLVRKAAYVDALLDFLDRFIEAASVAAKLRTLRPIERRLERELSKAFDAQGKAFLKAFRELRSRFVESIGESDWGPLFDEIAEETVDLFYAPIQRAAGRALVAGAANLVAEIGEELPTPFTLRNPRAVAYLEQHGYGLISQINSVTRGNIATIVNNGVAEGWSYNRTAREIISLYAEMAEGRPQEHIKSRAHLIAVTEAGTAYETGNRIVVDDLAEAGIRMEHSWLTAGDDRVSEQCAANEAQGWIPLAQSFESGHTQPPRFPGCRCSALYRRAPS